MNANNDPVLFLPLPHPVPFLFYLFPFPSSLLPLGRLNSQLTDPTAVSDSFLLLPTATDLESQPEFPATKASHSTSKASKMYVKLHGKPLGKLFTSF